MKKLILLLAAFIQMTVISAMIINVPSDYSTIQEAINNSSNGDTVLVSSGTYYENINFHGKNIVVASHFIVDNDVNTILSTIIDGSQPNHPDTASCVLFISGEDSTSVLAGFTITGGMGTKWKDEHNPSYSYTEGGAILIQFSSPTIRNNVIEYNEATNHPIGITSAGGGAIRAGDSNPRILNNMIIDNEARYGGGIVLNFSGAVIKNNIIAYNSGGQDYGGGGLWIYSNGESPIIIENNTIYENNSSTGGGAMRIISSNVTIINSIIWGNTASYSEQILGTADISYSNIMDGFDGEGNMDTIPYMEVNNNLLLSSNSPSIDAGNPDGSFNDPEDISNPGHALFPSKGTITNDMGAYGGPGSMEFPFVITSFEENRIDNPVITYPNPADNIINFKLKNKGGNSAIFIFDNSGRLMHQELFNSSHIIVNTESYRPGLYIFGIQNEKDIISGSFIRN